MAPLWCITAALVAATRVQAAFKGFNAGSTNLDGSYRNQADFEAQFRASAGLPGTNGQWTSARLYSMVQINMDNHFTVAIPAAIATNTSLLLGIWASSGNESFQQELTALGNAVKQYGTQLSQLTIGISVGSEDIYRTMPEAITKNLGQGADADTISIYIGQVRKTIQGTALDKVPVGHIDTQAAWADSSSAAVIFASDFLGLDFYPYYLANGTNNTASNSKSIFLDAFTSAANLAGGKPVWVTETGWPVSGAQIYEAVASVDDAETYWNEVQCELDSMNINTFWYTLDDSSANSTTSFNILENGPGSNPRYDLSCSPNKQSSTSSSGPSSAGGSSSNSGSSSDSQTKTQSDGLSVGAKAAIGTIIPVVVLLLGGLTLLLFLRRRRQRRSQMKRLGSGDDGTPELDANGEVQPKVLVEADNVEVQELESSESKDSMAELPPDNEVVQELESPDSKMSAAELPSGHELSVSEMDHKQEHHAD